MIPNARLRRAGCLAFATAVAVLAGTARAATDATDAKARGERVFRASGGCSCHTNYPGEGPGAPELAGGRSMATPFGTFYSTNITPDPTTGIGRWSDEDFLRAMTEGKAPDGSHYFPVFPYPAFATMTRQDLLDMKAYLFSLPPVARENLPPDALPPFRWRMGVAAWKALNFDPQPFAAESGRSAAWNRGAYLVNGPAHCGECHTPRTLTGGLDASRFLAGSAEGPEGELAPNVTPDPDTGIGEWSVVDLAWYLETGIKPDGDDTQGLMAEVIEHGYEHLPDADRRAIAEYVLSLPPIVHQLTAESGSD